MLLNKYIDHTILKADASLSDVDNIIKEAKQYDFASVCINPSWVKHTANALQGTDVLTCTVIGFPLGANTTEVKVLETKDAINNGAQEIDMVINIAKLKDQDYDYVLNEIKQIKEACQDKVLKVIIETCLLTNEEKTKACELIIEAKADFVKTSTGFSTGGATLEDIQLFKSVVKEDVNIKASGGVKTYQDAINMIEAGANRIGTSGGVNLVTHKDNNSSY
ncbi:MAG: deoxyribose-phosphate aldolase [Mycoplasmatales bacterium]